ncbi:MAG: GTP-binding protein, partial [Phycisphaerales bacterium]|nr:GTP-binding protein [Phycisphaerales bacterium]
REDLLAEVSRLAGEKRFDYLLIEGTGIAEPLPVAQTFTFEDDAGTSLQQLTRLDTMVTVVDAFTFLDNFASEDDLAERLIGNDESDTRSIADLLTDQVEFADVIVINKCDLVSPSKMATVTATVRSLNSDAKLIYATRANIPLAEVLGTHRFDMDKASRSAKWIKELNSEHAPETEEYGVSSFVFEARRPFHPQRLYDFIVGGGLKTVRSKGFIWLANRSDVAGLWSQAGGSFRLEPAGMWWAARSDGARPDEPEARGWLDKVWREPFGDRRQQLVMIGIAGQWVPAQQRAALEACLLTDREMAAGLPAWATLPDPFPAWHTGAMDHVTEDE